MDPQFALEVETTAIAHMPGDQPTELACYLRYFGSVIDRLQIRLEGIDPRWATLQPPAVSVFPGQRAPFSIQFAPPERARAGTYGFLIRATSQGSPDQEAVVKAQLEILAVGGISMEMTPQRADTGGRAHFALRLRGLGNAERMIHLRGSEDADQIRFRFQPADVLVTPDEDTVVPFSVQPRRALIVGARRELFFTIAALPIDDPLAEPFASVLGRLGQLPRFPWLPRLFGSLRGLGRFAIAAAIAIVLLTWTGGAPGTPPRRPLSLNQPGPPSTVPTPSEGQETEPGTPGAGDGPGGASAGTAGGAAGAGAGASVGASAGAASGTSTGTGAAGHDGAAAGEGAVGPDGTPIPLGPDGRPIDPPSVETFRLAGPAEDPTQPLPLVWDVEGANEVRVLADNGAEVPVQSTAEALPPTPVPPEAPRPYQAVESVQYTLTATNPAGSTIQRLVLYVLRPPTITAFTADPPSIRSGQTVRLSWQVQRADRVFLDGQPLEDPAAIDVELRPTETRTYELRAESSIGQDTRQITVAVRRVPGLAPAGPVNSPGAAAGGATL